jgi:prepilin-type N-terminal cleavage/methylation domain-containing protein
MAGRKHSGFTLIELLIVIAIILILIAIAMPNFMEAQSRAKFVRVKSEFQSLATALEAYRLDHRKYPFFDAWGGGATYNPIIYRLIPLTTPTKYIDNVSFHDPFLAFEADGFTDDISRFYYNYRNHEFFTSTQYPDFHDPVWILNSMGPDAAKNQGLMTEVWARGMVPYNQVVIYSPTNGSKSPGDIPRTGGMTRYRG